LLDVQWHIFHAYVGPEQPTIYKNYTKGRRNVITKEATLHALILAKNGEIGMNDKNAFLQRLQCTSSF
jgi:hypothetical protein